jgi:hypothetical protein
MAPVRGSPIMVPVHSFERVGGGIQCVVIGCDDVFSYYVVAKLQLFPVLYMCYVGLT